MIDQRGFNFLPAGIFTTLIAKSSKHCSARFGAGKKVTLAY
jgi:hypothetical protein